MTSLSELSPMATTVAMLLIVGVAKYILLRFSQFKPFTYFQFYCRQLARKVNKASNSQHQQKIAGFIAVLITFIPLVVILWLFEAFVAVDWLWQSLLLFFAIDGLNLSSQSKHISQALTNHNNEQAKHLLDEQTLRDCSKLSSMGISKAAIEMQLLKSTQLLFAVGFWFLTVGPLMAISYRLIIEMHYSWNIKQKNFEYFGQTANLFSKVLSWLPSRLFYLCYMFTCLGQNFSLFWRLTRQHFFSLSNDLLITLHALCLSTRLGGVAIYNDEKLRKVAFNEQARQPEVSDVLKSNKLVNMVYILVIIVLLFIVALDGLKTW